MELIYSGGDRQYAYLLQHTAMYLARFPIAKLVVRRVVQEDELEGDKTLLCLVTDRDSKSSARLVVVIHDEVSIHNDEAKNVPAHDGRWHLFRGHDDELNFAQLMKHVALQAERMRLHQLIADPIVHDLRGALGIVALSAELLKSQPELDKIVQKLLSARSKAEALVSELQLASTPDFLNPFLVPEPQETRHHALPLHEIMRDTSTWFSAAHREHQFKVEPLGPATAASRYSGVILRGLVDTLARLSSSPSEIRVSAFDDRKLQITLESQLETEQRQALERSSAAIDVEAESHGRLPFRWWLCLYAARAEGSKLRVNSSATQLTLVYEY